MIFVQNEQKPASNANEQENKNKSQNIIKPKNLIESKALSELPKIHSPKEISFLSDKILKKTKMNESKKFDRFAELPLLPNTYFMIFSIKNKKNINCNRKKGKKANEIENNYYSEEFLEELRRKKQME